ncbi:MAG: histidine kinase [Ignavibacteriaceae bacterium]|nr:ATP-binding protein [Ignavibacteriaceae bacterium]NUM69603.1 histidine kinase [Ignavibacteriaceae bacterium]
MSAGIISTISSDCKRCYSCIRECPAKAIKVINGQATIMQERCISCGHCIKVCSQHAKYVYSYANIVLDWLMWEEGREKIAMIAPSFAASFPDNYSKLPAALKKLGFDRVCEVSFGADLLSPKYVELIFNSRTYPVISSTCPAINHYIQKYFNELTPNLAPVVSPMIALSRYLRQESEDSFIVFIGPCTAKKDEFLEPEVANEIDAVLSFNELKGLFRSAQVDLNDCEDSQFDPPHANLGKAFPLSGGLLKAADLPGDILDREIIVAEGKSKCVELIEEIAKNNISAKFVDMLFCEGCISGPAIDSNLNYYSRREKVIEFIDRDMKKLDKKVWRSNIYNARDLDLTREFSLESKRRAVPDEETITEILKSFKREDPENQLNCMACGYVSCREFAIAIGKGLGEFQMCLPHLLEELEQANEDLKTTQDQLHSAEKLASIGQLAAGVAHEINNPLGTILLYSGLLKRMAEKELPESEMKDDLELITLEATRCKNIVANLLNFARQGKLSKTVFSLSALIKDIFRKVQKSDKFESVTLEFSDQLTHPDIYADKDQLEQVLINMYVNAADAMEDSVKKRIKTTIGEEDGKVLIKIKDTGCGIPEENAPKLFTPFFTTKPQGKGTGLGLAITYGIVKMHRGEIRYESTPGEGTEFTIIMPVIEESKDKINELNKELFTYVR